MPKLYVCIALLLLSGCYCAPGKGEKGVTDDGYASECWNWLKEYPNKRTGV